MILKEVNMPILINRVINHSEVKQSILNCIDNIPNASLDYKFYNDKISKTDWPNNSEHPKPYWKIIEPIIEKTVFEKMFSVFKCDAIEIANYWFQQYSHADTHEWHVHPHCHWTNIYFIELPDESVKTQVLDYKKEKLIDFAIQEGDILTFPSMLYHRSPPNYSDKRKTIVSFNVTVTG
jgi:hypothetical protein